MLRMALLTVLVLLAAPLTYRAQQPASLVDKIKVVVAAAERGWNHQTIGGKGDGGWSDVGAWELWKFGDRRAVQVTLELLPSPKDAYARMRVADQAVQVGGIRKLKGLGDDASVWENSGNLDEERGRITIHFRKGSLFVMVDAYGDLFSPDDGKRFARHVVNQIVLDGSGKLRDRLH